MSASLLVLCEIMSLQADVEIKLLFYVMSPSVSHLMAFI